MRIFIYLFCILIFLYSCEKSNDESPVLNTDFNHKILNSYFIQSIAFDKQGNAWIGTFYQGLIKYNPNETMVYNLSNSAFPDTTVNYDIAVDSKNNIWISCEGLCKFDGESFVHYHSKNSDIPVNHIESIAIDTKDNIWFTSCDWGKGGVVKYDGTNWTIYTPLNSDLPVHVVNSIAIDKNDNAWLALTYNNLEAHLVKISNENWTVYTQADLGFSPLNISKIQFNSKNKLCGSIDYSIICAVENNGPQVFIFDGQTTEQLQFDNVSDIRSLTVDKNDNIWCNSSAGYAVYDGEKWAVDDTSFQSTGVFAIEQSPDGRIWIGTGDGIYVND